jgi:hypothetical protein
MLGALGLAIRTIIQAPVKALTEQSRIITAIWWLSPQRPFGGKWNVTWKVVSRRHKNENVDCVHIRRLFSYVTFRTTAVLLDGTISRCAFVGKLVDKTITGRWFNPDDEDRGYFGAFQIRLHGGLHEAKGSWVGWRNDGTVDRDDIVLTRAT